MAANGTAWLGMNYGRLARLRLVTGYPGSLDWSKADIAPENDGIFIVDVKTVKKRLLVGEAETNPISEGPALLDLVFRGISNGLPVMERSSIGNAKPEARAMEL